MLARGLAGSLRVSSLGRSNSGSSRLAMSAPNKRLHPFFAAAGVRVGDGGENDSSKRAKSGAAANDDNGGGDGSNEQQPRRRAPTAPRLPASTPAPEAAQLSADHPPPLPRAPRDPSAFVALSWNVPGLNSMLARDPLALSRLVAAEGADALCLQEHKLQPERTKPGAAGRDGAKEIFGDCCLGAAGGGCASSHRANGNKLGLPGWHVTWACSTKKLGYSGVAIASRVEPLSVRVGIGNGDVAAGDGAVSSSASSSSHPHDVEGRFVAVEFERFWLATAYVPNSSEGLKRLKYRVGEDFSPARATAASGLPPGTPCWDQALANFVAGLRNASSPSASASASLPKPVVLMGDLNCARTPLDIYTTKGKADAAGFTKEEQESFERRLLGGNKGRPAAGSAAAAGAGLRDVWRERHPGRREYTYWSHRGRCFPTNNGWRLDYALAHPELAGGGRKGGGKGGGDEEEGDDDDGDGGDGEGRKGKRDADERSLIHDVFHLQHLKGPSDHCPIGVAILAEGHGEELV